jgi:SAM-dependent methyltransferase
VTTLRGYYDGEYAGQSAAQVGLTRVTRHPADRHEAVVKLAWPGGDTLLEVGAGPGLVLRTLRPRYRRCVATELSHSAATCLRELFRDDSMVEVHEGPIEDGLPSDARFDTIILNAVIEHLVDPLRTVKMLSDRLTPQGRLIITTPNLAKWTRRTKLALGRFPSTASRNEGLTTYGGVPAQLYDEGHLHYFTFRSLTLVLKERCGLASVEWFGFPGRAARLWPTLFSTDVCVTAGREST